MRLDKPAVVTQTINAFTYKKNVININGINFSNWVVVTLQA